jgi:hypothetical protein
VEDVAVKLLKAPLGACYHGRTSALHVAKNGDIVPCQKIFKTVPEPGLKPEINISFGIANFTLLIRPGKYYRYFIVNPQCQYSLVTNFIDIE